MSEEPRSTPDVLTNPLLADPSALAGSAMGHVSLETEPQQSEFTQLVDGFSALTIQLTEDPALKDEEKIKAINEYLISNRVQQAIIDGDYSTKELSYFVDVAADIWNHTGELLTSMLTMANRSALDELYRSGNSNLLNLVTQEANNAWFNPDQYYDAINVVEAIVKGVDGRAIDWARESRNPTSELSNKWWISTLVEDDRFPTACANSEFDRVLLESVGNKVDNRRKIRKAENEILEAFGVSEQMSKEFRLSLRARTVPKVGGVENGKPAKLNDTDGIDQEVWAKNIGDYCQNVRGLGTIDAEALRQTCGVVNLDRYEPHLLYNQMRLLKRLTPGGKELHEVPRDVTVIITDAFGDYNGSANDTFRGFDPNSTLVFEMHKPEDLPAYFALLEKMGIKPSTLVLNTHGNEGVLGYNQGEDRFYISSFAPQHSNERHIKTLGIGRFIQEGMQPHSISKEREILLYACYGLTGSDDVEPIAEAIIKETEWWNRAVVKAAEESVSIARTDRGDNEQYYKPRRTTFIKRITAFLHRDSPIERFPGWELAQIHELRRGMEPGEVIRSRREKGALLRTTHA